MPNYMGYYPQGMSGVQGPMSGAPQMYQQMPATTETPVMSLPPLYVGPPMGMAVPGGQVINNEPTSSESASSKKKHTSQWALEKRRARNRVTAAESRKKSKSEALLLKDEVQRLGADLKGKNDVLQEFKDKLEMYEQGTSKADIEQFIAQRRVIAAAAAVVTVPAVEPVPAARPAVVPSVALEGIVAMAQAHVGEVQEQAPAPAGQIAEL
jgi:hypothetical protein